MVVACGEVGSHDSRRRSPGWRVAVQRRRYGRPARRSGRISRQHLDGVFRKPAAEALRERNVDTQLVSRLERPSTLAFVNRDSVEPEYTF